MTIAAGPHVSVQGAGSGTSSAINTAGMNLLVATITDSSGTPTVTDSKSNVWVQIGTYENDGNTDALVGMFYVLNPTVGSGHTFTIATSNFSTLCIESFSGVKTSGALGTVSQGNSASGSSINPGSITPPADNYLFVTGAVANNTNSISSIGSSFTITDNGAYNPGVAESGAEAYFIQGSAAALNPTWMTDNAFGGAAIMAIFAPAASSSFTLTAAFGAFTMTGEAATLTFAQPSSATLIANPGLFSFTGAQSQTQAMLYAVNASFAMTGKAATLSTGIALTTLVAAFGSFSLTGEDAVLQGPSYIFPAFTGYFVMTGEDALIPPQGNLEYLPNFVGMEWLDASRVIYQGGFTELNPQVVRLRGPSAATKRGIVVGQTPEANTLVKPGASVQLSVASDHMLAVSFEEI